MTKILVIGSILKEFPKAVAKINSINAKHGPFEFCLVAGHVKVENIENVSLNLTTYVVGDCLPMENLVALGSHGILSTAAGITIGYAGFQENMELEGKTVDILLTNEWPLGIFNNSATNPMQVDSSLRIAEIAANLMPRYHFASTNNVFWEREPYKNQNNTFTRFIAIADFNNDKKQRWFYAMNFGPKKAEPTATESPYAASIKRPRSPDNGTGYFWNESAKDQMIKTKKPVVVDGKCKLCKKSKCPHTLKKQIPDGYICRICGIPGHHIYDCPHGHTAGPSKKQKGSKCWFCLSNPDVASHLIVTVLDDVYVALAKGGLNEGHLLVVPVNLANKVAHLASTRQLELVESSEGKNATGIQKDLKRVEDLVAKMEYDKGNSLVCFEVFIGGDQTDKNVRLHHLHFQVHFIYEVGSD